jgi:hypothetical protein
MFWAAMELYHYPCAAEMRVRAEDRLEQAQQAQAQQAAMQQQAQQRAQAMARAGVVTDRANAPAHLTPQG